MVAAVVVGAQRDSAADEAVAVVAAVAAAKAAAAVPAAVAAGESRDWAATLAEVDGSGRA